MIQTIARFPVFFQQMERRPLLTFSAVFAVAYIACNPDAATSLKNRTVEVLDEVLAGMPVFPTLFVSGTVVFGLISWFAPNPVAPLWERFLDRNLPNNPIHFLNPNLAPAPQHQT